MTKTKRHTKRRFGTRKRRGGQLNQITDYSLRALDGGKNYGPIVNSLRATSGVQRVALGGSRRRMRRGGQSSSVAAGAQNLWSGLTSGISGAWNKAKGLVNGSTTTQQTSGGYKANKRLHKGGQVVGFDGDWKEYGPAVGGRRRKKRGGYLNGSPSGPVLRGGQMSFDFNQLQNGGQEGTGGIPIGHMPM